MTRTQTNDTAYAVAFETSPGVVDATTIFRTFEPNEITAFGPDVEKAARSPISQNRQRRKGAIIDLDSAPGFEADLTMEHVNQFIEGFMFSVAKGPAGAYTLPTAVAAGAYTVPTMSAAVPTGRLVFTRGFANAINNGLKVTTTGGTTTSITIAGGGLTVEAPGATPGTVQNATLEVVGVRGATADITINAQGNIQTTALDCTTLGLTPGQWIFIGGDATITQFATAANRGWARVLSVTTTIITLDKRQNTFVADTGTGKTIDIYFGRFIRNVAVSHADYLIRYFRFEAAYNDLNSSPGVDEYQYALTNLADELSINLAYGELATMTMAFVGTTTLAPSTTRATNANVPLTVRRDSAFSPAADVGRLRIAAVDDSGITTDFKTMTLTMRNNVTAEKVIGQLGAKYLNTGNFEIDMEAQVVFSNSLVIAAVLDNRTVGFDMAMRNGDGGFVLDIPEATIANAPMEMPVNESVNLQVTIQAHQSSQFGYSLGTSLFGFLPGIPLS